MKAGWIGQMIGVTFGEPTEFQYRGRVIPEKELPVWNPSNLRSAFWQDDLYIDVFFIKTLLHYGIEISPKDAGEAFSQSTLRLWHANAAGRKNLQNGISPFYSGHPVFNAHSNDLDYQIEADFSGLIAPGLSQVPIEMGERFGRLLSHGDGLYGGQFIGCLYTEAFFYKNMHALIQDALHCIPFESQYAEMIRDVLSWYQAFPNNWKETWKQVEEKYNRNPTYKKLSCPGEGNSYEDELFNIGAKINGAYIIMGLLYGEEEPAKTIRLTTSFGQDSDCNPSNAAGILFTALGFHNLPKSLQIEPNSSLVFENTNLRFSELLQGTETLAKKIILQSGGSIKNSYMLIPKQTPIPSRLEFSLPLSPSK